MVVDFSINRDDDGLVLVEEGLVAGGGVHDSQPLVSEIAIIRAMQPAPIWASVFQSSRELDDARSLGSRCVRASENGEDSTHRCRQREREREIL